MGGFDIPFSVSGLAADSVGNVLTGGYYDFELAKQSSYGNLLLERKLNTTVFQNVHKHDLVVDENDRTYSVGENFDNSAYSKALVVCQNKDGTIHWQRGLKNTSHDYYFSSLYCGHWRDGLYAGGTVSTEDYPTVAFKGLLACFSASGTLNWVTRFDTDSSYVTLSVISIASSSEHLFIVGKTVLTSSTYSGTYYYWVAKLTLSGGLVWQKKFPTATRSGVPETFENITSCVTVDSAENVYVVLDKPVSYRMQATVTKLDSDGELLWQRTIADNDNADVTINYGAGIYLGSNDDLYVSLTVADPLLKPENALLLKFTFDGEVTWGRQFSGVTGTRIINKTNRSFAFGGKLTNTYANFPKKSLNAMLPKSGGKTGTFSLGTFGSFTYSAMAATVTESDEAPVDFTLTQDEPDVEATATTYSSTAVSPTFAWRVL